MVTKELSQAAVEINSIFENMSDDLLNKIPLEFKKFFKEIESTEYKFEYDKKLKLSEQKLLPMTQGLLSLIYIIYLCEEEEKEEFYKEFAKIRNENKPK